MVSTIWFLVRVIPRPSRLNYHCMKIAAPLASSFLLSAAGIGAGAYSFRKALRYFRSSRYVPALAAILLGIGAWIFMVPDTNYGPYATSGVLHRLTVPDDAASTLMGIAKGIFPGCVVWVHNPDANA